MTSLDALTPKQIVSELDKYIIGQDDAKRFVAVALRNRWRRQQVPAPLQDEIVPKNIIMIGPTGVGKTEIARRLANLAQSPFLKIEATKFTEVGYVGRDVESMIRDLTDLAVNMVRKEEMEKTSSKAKELAEERLLDLLLPPPAARRRHAKTIEPNPEEQHIDTNQSTREKFRRKLRDGKLDDRDIEIDVARQQSMPMIEVFSNAGVEDIGSGLKDVFGKMFPAQNQRRKLKVPEALGVLEAEESAKLIDMDKVLELAIRRTEQTGIVFLDEIDKIASRHGASQSGEVSREGVQRDLLPIVEGATVTTKHGMVKTDHILFIASGAFHIAKPADLIPELQGRFPLRVELQSLNENDFYRILTEPENALLKQYTALIKTEGLDLTFSEESIQEIARIAADVNMRTENIGARRLHTVLEKVLEKISFDAPEFGDSEFTISAEYVKEQLTEIAEDEDLSRFIL